MPQCDRCGQDSDKATTIVRKADQKSFPAWECTNGCMSEYGRRDTPHKFFGPKGYVKSSPQSVPPNVARVFQGTKPQATQPIQTQVNTAWKTMFDKLEQIEKKLDTLLLKKTDKLEKIASKAISEINEKDSDEVGPFDGEL